MTVRTAAGTGPLNPPAPFEEPTLIRRMAPALRRKHAAQIRASSPIGTTE